MQSISKEDLVGKKEIIGSEKYYLLDTGFYKSQLEEKQRNIGHILENIIFIELKRHGYKITIGKVKDYEIASYVKKITKKYTSKLHIYWKMMKQLKENLSHY